MAVPVEARLHELWRDLVQYAVNFDFQVGVQPLSTWQAPAVRRGGLLAPTSVPARLLPSTAVQIATNSHTAEVARLAPIAACLRRERASVSSR